MGRSRHLCAPVRDSFCPDDAKRLCPLRGGEFQTDVAALGIRSVIKLARSSDSLVAQMTDKIAGPESRFPGRRIARHIDDSHAASRIQIAASLGKKRRRSGIFD